MRKLISLLLVLSIALGCKQSTSKDKISNDSPLGFTITTPDSAGFEVQLLRAMEDSVRFGTYPNIHSVLIAKDGKLVYEQYFEGYDEIWGDSLGVVQHAPEKLHDVRSVSKSIVSACVGIAIKQGHIRDVNQHVFDFFPEFSQYNDGYKSMMTIQHLLNMTSGLEWNENVPYSDPENSEIRMTGSPDPMEYVLSRPMDTIPGSIWEYNGGTTQLLATIIKKTSGLEIDEFSKEYLFEPMNINTFEWTRFPDIDLPAAASGLRLTSRDLLKFGSLYTNHGMWQERQILPREWVEDSLKSYITLGRNNNVGYGYQFWLFDGRTISEKLRGTLAAAVGNGDQRIYIDNENEMIVVTTAGNYNNWTIKKDSEALLADFIYPALSID